VDVEVTIEIPTGQRNKYQIDHETGRVQLDRYLYTSWPRGEDDTGRQGGR
jgi:inorganic pyrophosphatase